MEEEERELIRSNSRFVGYSAAACRSRRREKQTRAVAADSNLGRRFEEVTGSSSGQANGRSTTAPPFLRPREPQRPFCPPLSRKSSTATVVPPWSFPLATDMRGARPWPRPRVEIASSSQSGGRSGEAMREVGGDPVGKAQPCSLASGSGATSNSLQPRPVGRRSTTGESGDAGELGQGATVS
jgi:hypothetical protein